MGRLAMDRDANDERRMEGITLTRSSCRAGQAKCFNNNLPPFPNVLANSNIPNDILIEFPSIYPVPFRHSEDLPNHHLETNSPFLLDPSLCVFSLLHQLIQPIHQFVTFCFELIDLDDSICSESDKVDQSGEVSSKPLWFWSG